VLWAHGLDALIVVAAVAAALGTALRDDPHRPSGVTLVVETAAMALAVLALLLRHRAPLGAPATTWLLCAGVSFIDGRLVVGQAAVYVAGLGASVLLGNLHGLRQARIGLAIVVGSAVVVMYNDPTHSAADFFFIPLQFAIAWLIGFALRERTEEIEVAQRRAEQAERDQEVAARIAVAEERARIARELHDVVAHAVSVMVLQVGAVRHRMPAGQEEDRDALKNVEQAGRTALTEMRRLLDAMRSDGEGLDLLPQPGLGALGSLLDDVRATGLDAQLHLHGEPFDLPPGLDLSAYRIVQEGLTNALKHAGAGRAEVDVEYGCGELQIEVRDDGRGVASSDGRGPGTGHGLVGVGERVKIYGGEMSAGPSDTGGFVLRARLPVEGRSP
jgi:signal transduction histidine kinase